MRLVDVLGRLGLHDVELAGQVEEVGVEVRVGHDVQAVLEEVLVDLRKKGNDDSVSRAERILNAIQELGEQYDNNIEKPAQETKIFFLQILNNYV